MRGNPLTIARLYFAPRVSIHEIALPIAAPLWSTGTVTAHSVVHATAMICSAGTREAAIASFAASHTARHHSSGSCSTAPPGMNCVVVWRNVDATTSPALETTATFALPEPMSMARTYFNGDEEGIDGIRRAVAIASDGYKLRRSFDGNRIRIEQRGSGVSFPVGNRDRH